MKKKARTPSRSTAGFSEPGPKKKQKPRGEHGKSKRGGGLFGDLRVLGGIKLSSHETKRGKPQGESREPSGGETPSSLKRKRYWGVGKN